MVWGDGGVHGEGLGSGGEGGAHRRGAKPSLCGIQEQDQHEASIVAHHLLDRVEGGEPWQRGPRVHDPRLQIQDRVGALHICDGILKLLDTKLIPSTATDDSKVFYLKMKGEWAPTMDSEEWEILSIEREESERIWD